MRDVITKIFEKMDWMKTFVGVSFVSIFIYMVVYVLKSDIPKDNSEIAHFIAGEVSGAALAIANFYFGSSKGSQEKQEIIKQQNEKAPS